MKNLRTFLPVFILLLGGIFSPHCMATERQGETPMGSYRDLIEGESVSQISFRAHGGRSLVDEYGISIKEYPEKVVLRVFKIWRNAREKNLDIESTLSKKEYDALWQKIEKFDVWRLEDVSTPPVLDAKILELIFSKDGKKRQVYAQQWIEPISNILLSLDEVAGEKLGIRFFQEMDKSAQSGKSRKQESVPFPKVPG